MNAAHPTPKRDPFVGYFATVIVALFASSWLAGLLSAPVSTISGNPVSESWQANVSAGFFLGIVAANPIAAFTYRPGFWSMVAKFVVGFIIGLLVQIVIFTPFTAPGMSNYMFLVLAALAVPTGMFLSTVRNAMERRGFAPTAKATIMANGFLNWSDRSMFVFLMALCFAGFTAYLPGLSHVVVTLVIVLIWLITAIARRDAKCERAEDMAEIELQTWLALEPEDPEDAEQTDGFAKFKDIVSRLLPGAILIGGMMHVAVHVVSGVFPDPVLGAGNIMQTIQNLALMSVGALGAVVAGILIALGASLASLRTVAFFQNWSAEHLHEKNLIMIRQLYLRPIKRYWQAPEIDT